MDHPAWPTPTESVVLRLLAEAGAGYGLQLVRASHGQLKRGSVYVLLERLIDKGFVEDCPEPQVHPAIGLQRRRYQLTGLGHRALAAQDLLVSGLVPQNE